MTPCYVANGKMSSFSDSEVASADDLTKLNVGEMKKGRPTYLLLPAQES
jgi:hypothetical protein